MKVFSIFALFFFFVGLSFSKALVINFEPVANTESFEGIFNTMDSVARHRALDEEYLFLVTVNEPLDGSDVVVLNQELKDWNGMHAPSLEAVCVAITYPHAESSVKDFWDRLGFIAEAEAYALNFNVFSRPYPFFTIAVAPGVVFKSNLYQQLKPILEGSPAHKFDSLASQEFQSFSLMALSEGSLEESLKKLKFCIYAFNPKHDSHQLLHECMHFYTEAPILVAHRILTNDFGPLKDYFMSKNPLWLDRLLSLEEKANLEGCGLYSQQDKKWYDQSKFIATMEDFFHTDPSSYERASKEDCLIFFLGLLIDHLSFNPLSVVIQHDERALFDQFIDYILEMEPEALADWMGVSSANGFPLAQAVRRRPTTDNNFHYVNQFVNLLNTQFGDDFCRKHDLPKPKIGVDILSDALADTNTKMLELLLSSRFADVNEADASGSTALMHAVEVEQLEAVRLLISHGANPLIANDEGLTPIMTAIDHNQPEILECLLEGLVKKEKGLKYLRNKKDLFGQTALDRIQHKTIDDPVVRVWQKFFKDSNQKLGHAGEL
jgi:hypothetical protein